jgi:hypothetical protein
MKVFFQVLLPLLEQSFVDNIFSPLQTRLYWKLMRSLGFFCELATETSRKVRRYYLQRNTKKNDLIISTHIYCVKNCFLISLRTHIIHI